jgi:CRP-like cAMP-binding protein
MSLFREYIKTIYDFDDFELLQIDKITREVHFKKGAVIYMEGDIINNLMFLNKGIARSYVIDNNGRDFTWGIYYIGKNASMKNLFIVDYASFIEQKPSRLTFEVIEDVTADSLKHQDLIKLFDSSEKWQKFGRLMSDRAYIITHNRVFSLLTENAENRYKKLVDKNPDLFEYVPQYIIASYLGIMPQSLSRIRANLK